LGENGILRSGIFERTVQLDFDEEVAFKANRKLHDLARSDDDRPFCLFVSFTHPHDPFAIPRRYWDRYRHDDIDMPTVPRLPRAELDAHSQRLFDHIGVEDAGMSDDDVRVARHAYYGAVSFIDDQIADITLSLQAAGLADNTVIVLLSDHGESLGERGLWFKRSFYDCALRIPLIVSAPGLYAPGRRAENVSLVDLLPTVVDSADPDVGCSQIATRHDGNSLAPLLRGEKADRPNRVFAEMSGEGLQTPAVAVIDGAHKYIHCKGDPPLLFDRAADPHERDNLAGQPESADLEAAMSRIVAGKWDLEQFHADVLESQRCRHLVDRAHAQGTAPSWDYDVPNAGKAQYFRPSPENPSASNYNDDFEVRSRPDGVDPNRREFP
jgi:choline-sulfatase